jgi:hypothetical protein
MITKETLKELLQQNVLEIKFKKVNGTERVMHCSLKKGIIPEFESKPSAKIKKDNENIISVWDIQKDAFRSFRLDSLIDYVIFREGYEL